MTIFPWKIWISTGESLRLSNGNDLSLNLKQAVDFLTVYVQGDEEGVILLNDEPLNAEANRLDLSSPIKISAKQEGIVNLRFSLFGIIPLRELTVNVIPNIKLYPCGHSIGIKLHSEGVIVVAFQKENYSPAKEAGIEIGDSIIAIENDFVENTEHAAQLIQKYGSQGSLKITIKRSGKEKTVTVVPDYNNETYRIGLYIRDTAAGVGTLTFYEPNTGRYGALGHVIVDVDTNKPVDISNGELVPANIIKIRAAQRGQPGEKTGVFIDSRSNLGTIDRNSQFGVFGQLFNPHEINGSLYKDPLPAALAAQVRPGKAKILTVLEGEKIEAFDIEIERIVQQTTPNDKGMIIRITDPRLLEETGGIVQGMSGSPIIQNDQLIGAVTHVFVNDPERGYGIFVEWMLSEAGIDSVYTLEK